MTTTHTERAQGSWERLRICGSAPLRFHLASGKCVCACVYTSAHTHYTCVCTGEEKEGHVARHVQ